MTTLNQSEWLAKRWISRLPHNKRAFAERFKDDIIHFFKKLEQQSPLSESVLDRLTLRGLCREALCREAGLLPAASDEDWAKLVAEGEEFVGMPITHTPFACRNGRTNPFKEVEVA